MPKYFFTGTTLVLSTFLVDCSTSSLSTTNGAILKSLGVDDSEIDKLLSGDSEGMDVEDGIRERDPEWWRDPLAMFDDSDGYDQEDDEVNSYESNSGSELESEQEEEVISCPIIPPFDDEDNDDTILEIPHLDDDNPPKLEDAEKIEQNKKNKGKNKRSKDSNGLPLEAQRRLAQHSILMKPEPSSNRVDQKSANNFSAPALPAILVISRLRSILPVVPPHVITLFVSLAGTQFVASHLFPKKNQSFNEYDNDQDQLDDDDIHKVEKINFLSKIFKKMRKDASSQENKAEIDDNDVSDYGQKSNPGWLPKRSKVTQNANEKIQNKTLRRISKIEIMDEMEHWRDRAEKAEFENDQLIAESERIAKEMTKLQSESSNLRSSMQYLKSQLRDNQKEMENVVIRERKKSEEEMSQVRDALLKVLRHERNLMREQVQKTSAQVRALLKEEKREQRELQGSDQKKVAD